MNLIIIMPEEIYTDVKENYQGNDVLYNAVKYGAPVNFCKYRTKDYVFYNDKWLKERWEMEMKLLGVDFSKHDAELLDKIRAEIEPKCDRINSLASVLSYAAHREVQELLCEIMDLFEPESEERNESDNHS